MPLRPRVMVLCHRGLEQCKSPPRLASPPLEEASALSSASSFDRMHHIPTPYSLHPPYHHHYHRCSKGQRLASNALRQIQYTMVSSRRDGGSRASRQASPSSSSYKVLGVLALVAAAAQAFVVPSVPSAASTGMATTGPRTPGTCLLFVF